MAKSARAKKPQPLEHRLLLTATFCLLAGGAVMVYSASSARTLLEGQGDGTAFLVKALASTWWVDLVGGILMLLLAFWTSGQFFIEKAYTLLVFAGIWALMHGITDVVGAFRLRSLKKVV